jgi:tetraacyldisaccharide 4'-kinase
MKAPAFWWKQPGVAAALLQPFAALYGAVAGYRLLRAGVRAGVPVVCFGGFTLGGAGKTPTALAAARLLHAVGERPAFLTRGYGGALAGPVQVDPSFQDAMSVGDEPLLLAREFPTTVARHLIAGAQAARAAGASVIVMDDGFYNSSIVKDCAVLVLDAERGLGNGRVFPAGPLRAPLAAQLQQANGILVIGAGPGLDRASGKLASADLPIFHARIEPDPKTVTELRGQNVLAFAGIGNPDKFFATLAACGIDAPVRRAFPDHHRFSDFEAQGLLREADAKRLTLVTTEKDQVRLSGSDASIALRDRTKALPIKLCFDEESEFTTFLTARLKSNA